MSASPAEELGKLSVRPMVARGGGRDRAGRSGQRHRARHRERAPARPRRRARLRPRAGRSRLAQPELCGTGQAHRRGRRRARRQSRAKYEAIAIANSGNTRIDAAIDIDGGIGTLKYYARLGASLEGRAAPARREAGAARQGRELPGDPRARAAPRRCRPHQRLQFPELGPVGEGRGVAACRRAGAGQARVGHGAAVAPDGARCHRGECAAGGRAQPAVRRRRRAARSRHRRRRDRLHRLVGDGHRTSAAIRTCWSAA